MLHDRYERTVGNVLDLSSIGEAWGNRSQFGDAVNYHLGLVPFSSWLLSDNSSLPR